MRVPHPQAPGDSCATARATVTAELQIPCSALARLAPGCFCGSPEGTGLAVRQMMAPPVPRAPS